MSTESRFGKRRCEEKLTEDANESDEDLLTGLVVLRDSDSDTSNDEVADDHSGGSDKEEGTTSSSVDEEESGNGGSDVDDIRGDGDDEGVRDTRVLEESGSEEARTEIASVFRSLDFRLFSRVFLEEKL